MKRTFNARIEGKDYEIKRAENGMISVDGHVVDVERLSTGDAHYLRIGTRSYDVSSLRPVDESYHVLLNGISLRVEVEDERAALLNAFGGEKATKIHSAILRSPMPGKISRVLVSEGELIEAGQGVLILEAMKMENEIKAPAAGIVKAIRVSESEAVEKNAVLIEIS
ncbi:MAG: acetyl-CoA carboxylase biotin carboxyl carrier protein subunit [Bacteroidota bacterium]|jgi:pyruvate carboxylase subunit B